MRVAMEIKLASPKPAPQQTRCCECHDDEGYDGLPVHSETIDQRAGLEKARNHAVETSPA